MKRPITLIALSVVLMPFLHGNTTYAQSWWAQTSNTTRNLYDINFSDGFTGYAFGDSVSPMLKTTSSGSPWTSLSPAFANGDLQSSAFLGSSNIVVVVGIHEVVGGKGVVMKTIDGGVTWTSDTSIPEKLFDVDFANILDGWVSGENGYIARTNDGGATWTQQTSGTGEDLFGIHFVDDTEGWAVGTETNDAVILHTTNAGTNWTEQVSGIAEPLFAVFFLDSLTGWAVGGNGSILVTADGGNNWVQQTSGTTQDLFDVHFLDTLKGWAVGGNGTVVKTTDGGTTWTSETSGTSQDIYSITMRNENLGWFCGDGGVIHMYGTSPVSVLETTKSGELFEVYPNPAKGRMVIRIAEENNEWNFELYDAIGRRIKVESGLIGNTRSIDDVPSGVYFLRIGNNQGEFDTRRVVFK